MNKYTLINVVKSLRMPEALFVSGFIIVGSLFGIKETSSYQLADLLWVIFISYTLMLSVYSSNAYLGYKEDKVNPRLTPLTLYSKLYYIAATFIFYIASFTLCLFINSSIIYFQIIIFVLWLLYSLPGFGKHLPLVGTIIHFIVAIIQFNFAYSFFSPVSVNSLLTSCYFALLFSAGHLHHEIIDYEVDAKNFIKSNVVKWGIKNMKHISFSLFFLAHIFWTVLFVYNYIGLIPFIIFSIGFLMHSVFFVFLNGQFEYNFNQRLKYRFSYRLIYLICGIVLTYTILL